MTDVGALSNKTTKAPPFRDDWLATVEQIACFVLVVLIVFALFGNTLVWVAFIAVKRLQKVTNFYIVSLATADLLVTLFAMTTWLLHMAFGGKILIKGTPLHTIYTMSDIACGTASIMSLTFVSIDRYLAITKPFSYQTLLSPVRVLGTILFSWTYALIVALLKFWIDRKIYPIFIALMSFFIPTTSMFFTYSCIFAVARRHVRVINVVSGNRHEKKFSYVTEMKAAKVIGIVVGAFLICWAPFLLTNLAVNYCLKCAKNFPVEGVYILKLLQYTSSALNPYIYTCLNIDFRVAVKRLMCRKCVTIDPSLSHSSANMEFRTNNLRTMNADTAVEYPQAH